MLQTATIPVQKAIFSPFKDKDRHPGFGEVLCAALLSSSILALLQRSDSGGTLFQFGFGRKKAQPATTVVPKPSYNIPLVLGGMSPASL